MSAFSTKGLTVWLEQKPGPTPTPVTITAATNSKPSVVTVSSIDVTKFVAGDIVTMAGTGISSLDGKSFIVGDVDDATFAITLNGSDASSATASATAGTITNMTTAFVEFCTATLEYQQQAAQAISVGTTCNPSAQIAGEPQAGTVSITGFVDYDLPGFLELKQALDDQLPRNIWVKLPVSAVPSGNGAIIYPGAVASGYSESFGVGQASTFTAEFTLSSRPVEIVD
jgi:hypothetical protein